MGFACSSRCLIPCVFCSRVNLALEAGEDEVWILLNEMSK
jgi:hypothetical protein